jgi:hypothetical protein
VISKAVRKYLEGYAEPEAKVALTPPLSRENFDACVVIPAFKEEENIFRTLASLEMASKGKKILCILVVNGKEADITSSSRLLSELTQTSYSEFKLEIIDRASAGKEFSEKEGVGLARKIGCDFALALISQGIIRSPWIRTTDADVILPADYFDEWDIPVSTSAFCYSFAHHPASKDLAEALNVYDESLHYYVAGLKYAGSPYAFHTIGSTLSIYFESYAEVRGFPKLMAGEDFYILNKLAKVGKVVTSPTQPLFITGRHSDRVPFGTGAGVAKVLSTWNRKEEFCFYHPEVFECLKVWLSELSIFAKDFSIESLQARLTSSPGTISRQVFQAAMEMQLFDELLRLPLSKNAGEKNQKHLHAWFDAFRTLKFVHTLRALHWPSIPYTEALSLAEFLGYKIDICKPPLPQTLEMKSRSI